MDPSKKANTVLKIFLFTFLAIIFRVWYLGVVQREEKLLAAQKPQQRTVQIRANRGTICDRFGIPMAVNKICYNAAIYYSQIAQIPTVRWQSDVTGRQIKVYSRKEYIRKLSHVLSQSLNMDAEKIEDLIHSKAALFPHVPFLLKSNLTEAEHYRLRMLEKDYPGIYAEISSKRFYPFGKTGCNILGTLGAINQKEYEKIAQEICELKMAADLYGIEEPRLAELKEKAYSMNDLIGKSGVEAYFEEDLRGFFGKKTFEIDQKGCFVREIANKEAIPGKRLQLTISSELQQFAENLLAQDEKTRDGRSFGIDPADKVRKQLKQPWIKGGAIVAIEPNTGEILALASYPQFDPNDFIENKAQQIHRWLENEHHIADLWDGKEELIRERKKQEKQPVTWEFYLDTILTKESPLRTFFHNLNTVKEAISLQEDYEAMLYFTKENRPVPSTIQKRLDAIPLSPQDKVFAVDLCRLAVYAPAFTDALIKKIGSMKISTYRALCQSFLQKEALVKKLAKKDFHQNEFRSWKQEHQKAFLAEMRKIEKENKTFARPYIDYLDKKEKELFATYWETVRIEKLQSSEFPEDLIRTFRSFSQSCRPLLGKYRKFKYEKDLAAAFYPKEGFGFSRSFAFETNLPQGSIFKLVTGYEALRQQKHLTLIDEATSTSVAYTLKKVPYPRYYKGGRLPRSASSSVGEIDLVKALERTSNPYFSILAGDYFDDPDDLAKAAKSLGFGEKTGITLPRENKGNIPSDLKTNRTGLYSTAIGQHTLLTTPLQTALMLSCIANGGHLFKPKITQDHLPAEMRRTVPMDEKIRNTLLEGMDQVVWGARGSARPGRIKGLLNNPLLMREFLTLEHQLVGKTGTAEILYKLTASPSSFAQMYKHIWFGAISFSDTLQQNPELVVVVMLRFGDVGKEAVPLAVQVIQKWREIKARS